MEIWVTQLFNGLSVSSILLLIALGLAITFGLMRVINMAHGEFIMIGAYGAYMTQEIFKSSFPKGMFDAYFPLAILVSFGLAFAIGFLLEVTLIRFLYGRPLDSLLATWGVGLMLQQLARSIFGAPNVGVVSPSWLNGGLNLMGGVVFPYKRLFIISLVILILVGMYFYIPQRRRTPDARGHAEPGYGGLPGHLDPAGRRAHVRDRIGHRRHRGLRAYVNRTDRAVYRHLLYRRRVHGRRARRRRQARRHRGRSAWHRHVQYDVRVVDGRVARQSTRVPLHRRIPAMEADGDVRGSYASARLSSKEAGDCVAIFYPKASQPMAADRLRRRIGVAVVGSAVLE